MLSVGHHQLIVDEHMSTGCARRSGESGLLKSLKKLLLLLGGAMLRCCLRVDILRIGPSPVTRMTVRCLGGAQFGCTPIYCVPPLMCRVNRMQISVCVWNFHFSSCPTTTSTQKVSPMCRACIHRLSRTSGGRPKWVRSQGLWQT